MLSNTLRFLISLQPKLLSISISTSSDKRKILLEAAEVFI
jgi:hypothetical protein